MAFDNTQWYAVEASSVGLRMFMYNNPADDDVNVAGYFLGAPGLVNGTTIRNVGSTASIWVSVADATIGTAAVDV